MFQHVVEVSSDGESSDEDRETPRGIFFRRSHRVATLCGLSSKEYRRMRRWQVPESLFMMLACIHHLGGWVPMTFDCVEWFAGVGMVKRAFTEIDMCAFAYDWEIDRVNMDFCSIAGFILAMQICLGSKFRSMQHFDILCSTWIWMARSMTERTAINPYGRSGRDCVANGNRMAARMVLIILCLLSKQAAIIIEQPQSSLLAHIDEWQLFEKAVKWLQLEAGAAEPTGITEMPTWMAGFGKTCAKATTL